MAVLPLFLLLAACFSTVAPGPVPRRQLFTSYSNTTSAATSTILTAQPYSTLGSPLAFSTSTENVLPSSSTQVLSLPTPLHSSLSIPKVSLLTSNLVNAETAVIIEPVQPTVIEHTISAITFVDPNGKPLVTQDLEILSSTSFITPPAPTSKLEHTSSAIPTPFISYEEHSTIVSDNTKKPTLSNSDFYVTASSSLAVVESDSPSGSTLKPPAFTYSPEEDETSTSLASSTVFATTKITSSLVASATRTTLPSSSVVPISLTATISSIVPISSTAPISSTVRISSITSSLPTVSTTGPSLTLRSSGLPGFSFNITGSRGGDNPKSSSYVSVIRSSSIIQSIAKSSSLPVFENSGVLTPPAITDHYSTSMPSGVANSTTKTSIVVTKTEYLTVFPTPSASTSSSLVIPLSSSVAHTSSSVSTTSSLIQEAISSSYSNSQSGVTPTMSTPSQNAISSSSAVPTLPSTPLVPPPVIIVTQYTTTTPPAIPLPSNTLTNHLSSALSKTTSVLSISSSAYNTLSSSAEGIPIPAPTPSVSTSKLVLSSNTSSASSQPYSTGYTPPPVVTSVASTTTGAPQIPTSVLETSTTEGPLIITPIPPSQIFTITVTEKEKETITETATVTVTASG